ncbi:MAG TPA: ribonuclease HI family protein [Bacteroidota bacterium]|nr:ribonuclease HI family protein [Bacteroidota bacterium]
MRLRAWTDGASRGNPGDAGIGVIVKGEDDAVLIEERRYLGTTTNNQAEYTALIVCIEKILAHPATQSCTALQVYADSELMVKQLKGEYKVRDEGLKVHYARACELLKKAPFSFSISHVPRAQNKEADRLANEGIDFR